MSDLQTVEMRTREQWGAVHDYTTTRPVEEPASQFFLHITVTIPSRYPSDDAHARAVEKIGIARFGIGISYNALCMPGGNLFEGQPPNRRGAHTVNDFGILTCPTHGGSVMSQAGLPNLNYSARAIALARMVDDPVTEADVDAIARWGAAMIREGHVRPDARWHGHRDVSAKSCPGPLGFALIPDIEQRMHTYLGEDMLTPAEEQFIRDLKKAVEDVGSNAGFPRTLIPWFRNWASRSPTDFASAGTTASLPAEEVVTIKRNV